MGNFTKAEIIDAICGKTGLNRKDVREVVDCFIDEIKAALVAGKAIELRGFGTFVVKVRKGRRGARNPRTGETVSVNSHGIAAFRPGRELKQDLWELPVLEAVNEKVNENQAAVSGAGNSGDVQ